MIKLHRLAFMIAGAAPSVVASVVAGAIVCLLPGLAIGDTLTDLRGITVGMSAQQLPATGYRDIVCAGRSLATWGDWASCPVDGANGLRPVHVTYDQPGGETKVAGHPVELTIFFDGSGRLARIEIKTDDHAPPYFHKKAYILARQAKAHYGEDGWTCKSVPASGDEEGFGPLYVNETCTKVTAERRIETSARLFRKIGSAPRDFVSQGALSISMVPAGSK